jgi:IS5 family transposase
VKGNPKDSELYEGTIEEVKKEYGKTPEPGVTDGGYASRANLEYAKEGGIVNIVFNKIVGDMINVCTSKRKEKLLKKWWTGIEAVISNLKRGFDIARRSWKGWKHWTCSTTRLVASQVSQNTRHFAGFKRNLFRN